MGWLDWLSPRKIRALCSHCSERLPVLAADDLGEHEMTCPACRKRTTVEVLCEDGRTRLNTWPTEDGPPPPPEEDTEEQIRTRKVLARLLDQTRAGTLNWTAVSRYDPRWGWHDFAPEFRAVYESKTGGRWALYLGYQQRLYGGYDQLRYARQTGVPEFWLAKIDGEMESEYRLATDGRELRALIREAEERRDRWLQEAIDAILAMGGEGVDDR